MRIPHYWVISGSGHHGASTTNLHAPSCQHEDELGEKLGPARGQTFLPVNLIMRSVMVLLLQ